MMIGAIAMTVESRVGGTGELFRAAATRHRAGALGEAEALYREILRVDPGHAEALHRLGLIAHTRGNHDDAAALIGQAIAIEPQRPEYHYTLGIVLHDQGKLAEAQAAFVRATELRSDFAQAHNNLGIVQQDQGRLEAAAESFRRAVDFKPGYAHALNNLGTVYKELGQILAAQECFEQAIQARPDYAAAYRNLGVVLMIQGHADKAEARFREAAQLNPDDPTVHNSLGEAMVLLGRMDDALASFRAALALKPDYAEALCNLGAVHARINQASEATACYRRALGIEPHSLRAALGANLTLPPVYSSRSDLERTRERFAAGLDELSSRLDKFVGNPPRKLCKDLEWVNFYLAYQGENDLDLQSGYANFVHAILEKAASEFLEPLPPREGGDRKLRVGFVSSFFWRCTVGSYFQSWLTRLDRDRFEIFVYDLGDRKDEITREVKGAADRYLNPDGSVLGIARLIKESDLDVLIYPELGMNGKAFLLAGLRLAPLQCAAWGHPVTSGHRTIDCFFTSMLMEPEDGARHYREELVPLAGIGTYYEKPAVPLHADRRELGLPEGRTLYLCPQSPFKIHPDTDALFARILREDEKGVLVMFEGRYPAVTQAFLARFGSTLESLGVGRDRTIVLPYVTRERYLKINLACDAMLDTLHWSGGNTSLDALACGLPMVTLPGRYMRGRQSYGMLGSLGLQELIARDGDDYVRIGTGLGRDKPWRMEMSSRIIARSDALFQQLEPLSQIEEFLLARGRS
jgi:CRISPR-associated protein Csy1